VLEDIGAHLTDTTLDRSVIESSLSSDQLSVWLSEIDAGENVAF
jgi:hypothetical protein